MSDKKIKLHLPMRQYEFLEINYSSMEEFEKEYAEVVLMVAKANKAAREAVQKEKDSQPPFEG